MFQRGRGHAPLDWLTLPDEPDIVPTPHYLHGQIWKAGGLVLDALGAKVKPVTYGFPNLQTQNPDFPKKAGFLIVKSRSTDFITVGSVTGYNEEVGIEEIPKGYQLSHEMGADYFIKRAFRKPRHLGPKIDDQYPREMRIHSVEDAEGDFNSGGEIDFEPVGASHLLEGRVRLPEKLTTNPNLLPYQLAESIQFAAALTTLAEATQLDLTKLLRGGRGYPHAAANL